MGNSGLSSGKIEKIDAETLTGWIKETGGQSIVFHIRDLDDVSDEEEDEDKLKDKLEESKGHVVVFDKEEEGYGPRAKNISVIKGAK